MISRNRKPHGWKSMDWVVWLWFGLHTLSAWRPMVVLIRDGRSLGDGLSSETLDRGDAHHGAQPALLACVACCHRGLQSA